MVEMTDQHVANLRNECDRAHIEYAYPFVETGIVRNFLNISTVIPKELYITYESQLEKIDVNDVDYEQKISKLNSDRSHGVFKYIRKIRQQYEKQKAEGLVTVRTMHYVKSIPHRPYCEFSARGGQTCNCSSWIEHIFGDVIYCSKWGISNPRWCRQIRPNLLSDLSLDSSVCKL